MPDNPVVLRENQVFMSMDTKGDFANEVMFVAAVNDVGCHIVFRDGYDDWFTVKELNVDPTSVRAYDPDTDLDYNFMLG